MNGDLAGITCLKHQPTSGVLLASSSQGLFAIDSSGASHPFSSATLWGDPAIFDVVRADSAASAFRAGDVYVRSGATRIGRVSADGTQFKPDWCELSGHGDINSIQYDSSGVLLVTAEAGLLWTVSGGSNDVCTVLHSTGDVLAGRRVTAAVNGDDGYVFALDYQSGALWRVLQVGFQWFSPGPPTLDRPVDMLRIVAGQQLVALDANTDSIVSVPADVFDAYDGQLLVADASGLHILTRAYGSSSLSQIDITPAATGLSPGQITKLTFAPVSYGTPATSGTTASGTSGSTGSTSSGTTGSGSSGGSSAGSASTGTASSGTTGTLSSGSSGTSSSGSTGTTSTGSTSTGSTSSGSTGSTSSGSTGSTSSGSTGTTSTGTSSSGTSSSGTTGSTSSGSTGSTSTGSTSTGSTSTGSTSTGSTGSSSSGTTSTGSSGTSSTGSTSTGSTSSGTTGSTSSGSTGSTSSGSTGTTSTGSTSTGTSSSGSSGTTSTGTTGTTSTGSTGTTGTTAVVFVLSEMSYPRYVWQQQPQGLTGWNTEYRNAAAPGVPLTTQPVNATSPVDRTLHSRDGYFVYKRLAPNETAPTVFVAQSKLKLPQAAVVTGVQITLTRRASAEGLRDVRAVLVVGGVPVPVTAGVYFSHTSPGPFWLSSGPMSRMENAYVGGASALWGLPPGLLTPSNVNWSFGVGIQTRNFAPYAIDAYWDEIDLKVFYTFGSASVDEERHEPGGDLGATILAGLQQPTTLIIVGCVGAGLALLLAAALFVRRQRRLLQQMRVAPEGEPPDGAHDDVASVGPAPTLFAALDAVGDGELTARLPPERSIPDRAARR